MSLYPTKTRVQLLHDVDAGLVLNDIRGDVVDDRIVLSLEEDDQVVTVTAAVRELQHAGWVEQDEAGVRWRLTQAGLAIAYPAEQTAGYRAVAEWSARIHGSGDRHYWAVGCAQLLDEHGPDAALPPFPSHLAGTRQRRDETVRRLYREAANA